MFTNTTTYTSCATSQQRPQENSTRNQIVPQVEALTSQSYFPAKRQLLYNSRYDKRLTPATQLIYRTLMDVLNINRWLQPFVLSNAELKQLTHITSDQDITRIKQRLKSMNYIDFTGKPTQYWINTPPAYKQAHQQAQTAAGFNESTNILNTTLKKKSSKEERTEPHGSSNLHDNMDFTVRDNPEYADFFSNDND